MMLSPTPQTALREMIDIISDLRGIYESETEALQASNVKAFVALQERKINAARLYESGIAQIMERRDEMQNVDSKLKTKLRAMQDDFSTLVHENKKALKRMRRMTDRLGETIRDAAKTAIKQRSATSYNAGATLHDHKRGNSSVGIQETA